MKKILLHPLAIGWCALLGWVATFIYFRVSLVVATSLGTHGFSKAELPTLLTQISVGLAYSLGVPAGALVALIGLGGDNRWLTRTQSRTDRIGMIVCVALAALLIVVPLWAGLTAALRILSVNVWSMVTGAGFLALFVWALGEALEHCRRPAASGEEHGA